MRCRPSLPVLSLFCGVSFAIAQEHDLVLRGGRIVDGTGRPALAGDLAIRDGRIAAVGTIQGRGRVEIDAHGRVVAPGFIDVHTHSEDVAELPTAENFIRMGVTTIVTGNCGSSKLDVGEFFRQLGQTGVTVNVATLIGHNTVRGEVMGGSFARPPTDEELARMCGLVERAMADGAVGLSTGLIYLPGTFAKTEEIIALAKVTAAHGGLYASHMRSESERIDAALAELARIARESPIRAEISHLKLSGPPTWGRAQEIIAYLDRARAGGLAITHDQYAYTATSTGIAVLVPSRAREGGTKAFRARLDDPAKKAAIVAEMKTMLKELTFADFDYAVIASYEKDPRLNGKTVRQAAKLARGSDSLDDQIELVLEITANGGASAVYHKINEDDLRRFLVHPLTMVASDSGIRKFGEGVPHPRGYGNNARVLGRYVRELKLLPLEEAVRKMSSLPAKTFRLSRRGELQPGFVADVVVFDPETVGSAATFEDPHHYATGFSDVIVNGTPVIRGGDLTGDRPGRPVKLKND